MATSNNCRQSDESSSDSEEEGFVFHIPGFENEEGDLENKGTATKERESKHQKLNKMSSLDVKIMEKRKRLGEENLSSEDEEATDEDDRLVSKEVKQSKKKKIKLDADVPAREEGVEEEARAFEAGGASLKDIVDESFDGMFGLSQPIRQALNKLKWFMPTPIQASAIPEALEGKDVCACASTGTGKTGAFMIPIVARVYLKKPGSSTTVLVLTPTRELAVQIAEVTQALTEFTKISHALLAGGLKKKSQEDALKYKPDILIATPGRLIDHLQSTPNFDLKRIEILVIDEADRMLDEHFADQLKDIIQKCPQQRQTILLSATMTEEVNDLAILSLKDPVKIFANENKEVALNLEQEYVNVRPQHESKRESVVAALVTRNFTKRCIVFVQTKLEAHRLCIVLGLLGVRVGELHGNLSQKARLEALQKFKERSIDILIATDVLGRGIDIPRVKTVINVTMPQSVDTYIHRVGRTARAERRGRAITLVSEKEWKMLKQIKKLSDDPFKQRIIPTGILEKYNERIAQMKDVIKEIEEEEAAEKDGSSAKPKEEKTDKQTPRENKRFSKPLKAGIKGKGVSKENRKKQRNAEK